MDADIVVFDFDTVTDRATYENPAQPSEGFDYVIVGGVVLVDDGALDTTVLPGKPVRNTVRTGAQEGR
jgi:N-acyl-D-glutamate deacylase